MSGGLCSEVAAGGISPDLNSRPVIARSLRRSDLARFWDVIGHTATRGIATSLNAPRDDEEENRVVRWLTLILRRSSA
jgi:hypothetical protein